MRNRVAILLLITAVVFAVGCNADTDHYGHPAKGALTPAAISAPPTTVDAQRIKEAKLEYVRLIADTSSDARDQVIGFKTAVCESYWRWRNFSVFSEANKNLDLGIEPEAIHGVLQAKANGFAMTVIAAVKGGVVEFGCHEGAPVDDLDGLNAAQNAVFASGGSLFNKLGINPKEFRQLLVAAARRRARGLVLQFGNDLRAESEVSALLDEFTQEELGLNDAVMKAVRR